MNTLDLYDPDTYLAGPPHERFDELRAESGVVWQDIPGQAGVWMVLRHADVVRVAREPLLFSAYAGGIVLEDLGADSLELLRGTLLSMDPPRHQVYRKPLAPSFSRRSIDQLEARIRRLCREILAGVGAQDGDQAAAGQGTRVEFVHDVTSRLPSQVIGDLMGLPAEDWGLIHSLAERNTSQQDADISGDDDDMTSSIEMAMYAIDFASQRRQQPSRDDLTSLLLEADFGGTAMSDVDFGSFFVQLVTAGNDTTKTMLSSGLLALLQHPEAMAELRRDPGLIPSAVEEILRWANPLHYFRRTATADTELAGVPIQAGDKVAMCYTAANRDPAVFVDPHRFDIHRDPNPHLSFGIGEHFCLGVHLARLEGRVFFEELLRAFPTIELAGEPVRVRSNLNNALKSLPVRLAR
jgi:cytochrome P450